MAHLGADVAAFVDGQLSDSAAREASEHLGMCTECEKAVRQQRLLKSRMSTVATPDPPAGLIASLAHLAESPPDREPWWSRLGRSVPLRAGAVLMGVSMAVLLAAYAVGGADPRLGDDVSPPFDRYAADFVGPATVTASHAITETTMDELDGSGWPCHETLAGDLHRTSGVYVDDDEVVALTYSDGQARLNLFEQVGRLDRERLDGFVPRPMAGSQVWVRDGQPALVTWDGDGVVYTIVTDADLVHVERAVAELPAGPVDDQGLSERVGDGITRMTSWVGGS